MYSGSEASDAEDRTSSLPDCPRCGEPVAFVTASGPTTASANPCGCSVSPGFCRDDHSNN
ncbi:hypothetical protein ACFR99_14730 [Haloarchaeobius amylolyticus]|uniref:Small CPxCG-related zinc finger protein n=1 Tax=Haloarchaeobius amylolyticus TaxID=1198296 RepID=A0ABD6BKZ1_9EURY